MQLINEIVNSPSAYLSLFILLLGYVLYSSYMREKEMREQLDKTVPVLEKILIRLDVIEDKIER
nr:MAG TPA: holin family protein [Caudoviricetes sp.]